MEQFYKSYDELEFTDDFMFCKILENHPKLCKELAQMITGESFGEIMSDERQKSVRILPDGHGVRFDVFLSDGTTLCDIEMQTTLKEGLPKRSRYYQSMIDVATFEKNTDYKKLKKSFIIFIVRKNPFPGENLRKYTFVNICKENKDIELGDDAIKIFLTPDGKVGSMSEELEALMTYMTKKKTESEFTKELDEQIRKAKEGSLWRVEYMQMRERMDEQREEGRKEGRSEGIKEGRKEGKKEAAFALLKSDKLSEKEIAEIMDMSAEEISNLKNKLS